MDNVRLGSIKQGIYIKSGVFQFVKIKSNHKTYRNTTFKYTNTVDFKLIICIIGSAERS